MQVEKWEPCGLVTAAVKGRCDPWNVRFIYHRDGDGVTLMGGPVAHGVLCAVSPGKLGAVTSSCQPPVGNATNVGPAILS